MNSSDKAAKSTTKRKIKSEVKDDISNKKIKIEDETDNEPDWKEYELIAEEKNILGDISKNIIKMFEEGNTIPFIARYRKDATNNMSPEMLREIKESYEDICELKAKINTVIKSVEKLGKLNLKLKNTIKSVRSMEELEIIYAPFKPGGKRTLAERAKELGLEAPAMTLLNNFNSVDLNQFVDKSKKELSTIKDVEQGIIHIIAYIFASDSEILNYLRKLRTEVNFILETKKSNSKQETKTKRTLKSSLKNKPVDESKFQNYFDYKIPVKFLKPHQILAINRGEHHKILSVKIIVPDFVFQKFSQFCANKCNQNRGSLERKKLIDEAIKDSYNRLVQPFIIREIRADLKCKAEKASCEVFSTNLKHLLLAAPLKGKIILAIDPGYSNGCKLAMVSTTGSVLSHNVVYPHKGSQKSQAANVLKAMLIEHNCNHIVLGNGTACRETEEWLSSLIKNSIFHPLEVNYAIVNEDGASIYSCSPEAKKEFPNLDPNIISAVSLARRIQDPLAELVKVEPQHLGVGMYQHDLKKKQLDEALNEVVSECVSFVGVDLNTASQCLLRKIAGLTDKRALNIIRYREDKGPFLCRKQLTEVTGIGAKVFEQCVGFLRVGPANLKEASNFYKKPKTTKLDCTYIHPESYDVAKKMIKKLNLKIEDLGESNFISSVNSSKVDLPKLSEELKSSQETLKLILEALGKPLNYDLRTEMSEVPLFKKDLMSIDDIHEGTVVTGRVKNVTHFGCFVDIGVGSDGLIHNSKLNGFNLQIGDRVEAKIVNIEIKTKRIGLEAVNKF